MLAQHQLLAKGTEVIGGLLPGFTEAVMRAGGNMVTPFNMKMVRRHFTTAFLPSAQPGAVPGRCGKEAAQMRPSSRSTRQRQLLYEGRPLRTILNKQLKDMLHIGIILTASCSITATQ